MELINTFDLKPGFLYVFGGRPGMGLTRLTIKLANELAHSAKVLFVSYQTTRENIIERMNEQGLKAEANFMINTSLPYYYGAFNQLRKIIAQHKINYLFIDDLDSFLGKDGYFNADNDDLIESFYQISIDLKASIILNLTVSQNTDRRMGSKKPQLRDFNWSRNIVNLACQLYGIFRPEYYGITEDENGESVDNIIEIDCLKDSENKLLRIRFDK